METETERERSRTRTRVQKAQEELVCSVCIETFSEPRTLACQHTFCTACLEQLAGARSLGRTAEKAFSSSSGGEEVTVSCPECRANITLPANGINGLPKNFKLERFIEILSPLEREEINQSTAQKKHAYNCLAHPKKPSEYYCTTCSTLACGDCLLDKHMNHKGVKRATEVLLHHMQALMELIPGAKAALKNGEMLLSAMQACSVSLEKQGTEATHDIGAYFDQLRAILSKRESDLKGEVMEQVEMHQRDIAQNRRLLENSVKEVRKCAQELEQIVRSESLDILMKEKQLKERLRSEQKNLEESCNTATILETLSITTPPLADARLEVLCQTLATKAPIPAPRKLQEIIDANCSLLPEEDSDCCPLTPDAKEVLCQTLATTAPVLTPRKVRDSIDANRSEEDSDCCSLTPDTKQLEEVEDEHLTKRLLSPLFPVVRNYEVTIVEPEMVLGPQNLLNSFFRTATGFIYPRGVCCGTSGMLIVTDVQNHCFRILAPTGKCLEVIGREGRSDGMFGEPTSVAADWEGNLLVCDLSPARVQKFSSEGKFITKLSGRLFRGNPLGEPWGIAVSYDGKIFVSDWDKSCIHMYNENGNYTGNFGSADVNSPLKYPTGIAIDKRGRIVIADRGNHVVWIFTPDGNLLSQFGKMGHAPGDLYFPFGVAVNKEGNIFISESGNHRISVFDAHGKFLRCFGKKGSEPGMFHLPRHMCIDSQARLVVCDEQNQRLQIFNTH